MPTATLTGVPDWLGGSSRSSAGMAQGSTVSGFCRAVGAADAALVSQRVSSSVSQVQPGSESALMLGAHFSAQSITWALYRRLREPRGSSPSKQRPQLVPELAAKDEQADDQQQVTAEVPRQRLD